MVEPANMPPKNITSVPRNTHTPFHDASCCCAKSSNWCACTISLLDTGRLRKGIDFLGFLFVSVRPFSYNRRNFEIVCWRRRRRFPFEAARTPGIGARDRPVTQGPNEIEKRQNIADGENRSSRR